MKKLKKELAQLFRNKCNQVVYSSEDGEILIPDSVLDLILEFLHQNIDASIDLDDGKDLMDFLKQHLNIKTSFNFHFDIGMGSSENPFYLVDLEDDRKYLIYYFGVLGEYWLLGALTNYNKHLLEKFFELSLLRKETSNPLPFQFIYGAPTSYDNYCKELISDDFLKSIFIQLEGNN